MSGAKHSGMRLHAEGCENATHDAWWRGKGRYAMTDGIKRWNVIREMQKRTIGEALYSKKIGRKPSECAKKIGVLPKRD